MKVAIPGFFLLVMITSCGEKNKVPKGILQPQKMEVVLWDILQADAFLKEFVINKDSIVNDTSVSKGVYEKVFQFNKISAAQFDTSFAYYQRHPALLKEILDSIYSKRQRTGTTPHQDQPNFDSTMLKKIRKARAVE